MKERISSLLKKFRAKEHKSRRTGTEQQFKRLEELLLLVETADKSAAEEKKEKSQRKKQPSLPDLNAEISKVIRKAGEGGKTANLSTEEVMLQDIEDDGEWILFRSQS